MVPVMIVAPKVAGHQVARFFLGLWHLPGRLFRLVFPARRQAVTPEGEVEWAPPIEQSAYQRVALTELERPAFAENLLTQLTQHSAEESER